MEHSHFVLTSVLKQFARAGINLTLIAKSNVLYLGTTMNIFSLFTL